MSSPVPSTSFVRFRTKENPGQTSSRPGSHESADPLNAPQRRVPFSSTSSALGEPKLRRESGRPYKARRKKSQSSSLPPARSKGVRASWSASAWYVLRDEAPGTRSARLSKHRRRSREPVPALPLADNRGTSLGRARGRREKEGRRGKAGCPRS